MKIFKVDDAVKAICNECKSVQNATFKLRNVPFDDDSGIVKNVLVGVCDSCDSVIVLPQQSVPAVQKARECKRKALESRVPAHMIDILNLASTELGGTPESSHYLIKYYIHSLAAGQTKPSTITKFLTSDLAKGTAQKRISLKGRKIIDETDQLKKSTTIKNTSDLIKGIVLKINDDILVKKNPRKIKELRALIAATA